MHEHRHVREVVDAFRRLRVRQGDLGDVLQFVAEQADALIRHEEAASPAARLIKSRALELKRVGRSLPKFVVEDLIEQSIAQLLASQARP